MDMEEAPPCYYRTQDASSCRLPPPYSVHTQAEETPEACAGHVVDGENDTNRDPAQPPCYVSASPPPYETLPRRNTTSAGDNEDTTTLALLQDNSCSDVIISNASINEPVSDITPTADRIPDDC